MTMIDWSLLLTTKRTIVCSDILSLGSRFAKIGVHSDYRCITSNSLSTSYFYLGRQMCLFCVFELLTDRLASCLKTLLSAREVLGSILELDKLNTVPPTARHRCDVSSSCVGPALDSGDGPAKCPLVTRFSIIARE